MSGVSGEWLLVSLGNQWMVARGLLVSLVKTIRLLCRFVVVGATIKSPK
jgi:hypothetical protein